MARETKDQIQARAQADNAKAAVLPEGAVAEGFFGTMILGAKLTDSERAGWADDCGPWDYYTVYFDEYIGSEVHPNMAHTWSSTVVFASFKGE